MAVRQVTHFSKPVAERRAFEALAPLIGWNVIPGSIQQPKPPEPDILCNVAGLGAMAVELTAIDDEDTRRRLSNFSRTDDTWLAALGTRAHDERRALDAALSDAHVHADFANQAGPKLRAAAFYRIQEFLSVNPGYDGWVVAEDIGSPQGFHEARVTRTAGRTDGPSVAAPSVSGYIAPQLEQIITKLTDKTYVTDRPLDLFAYAIYDEPDGRVGMLEAIKAAVGERLSGSKFQRVHLFHAGFLRHICSIP